MYFPLPKYFVTFENKRYSISATSPAQACMRLSRKLKKDGIYEIGSTKYNVIHDGDFIMIGDKISENRKR